MENSYPEIFSYLRNNLRSWRNKLRKFNHSAMLILDMFKKNDSLDKLCLRKVPSMQLNQCDF